MAAVRGRASSYHASIRTIWGIAKSPELALSEEDLYALIERETGKQHMRELSQGQIDKVCRVLQQMKDGGQFKKPAHTKIRRTDEGGNPQTVAMRQKIYRLTGQLGWNDNPDRVNKFALRMFGISRIEWLSLAQCYKLTEALKAMVSRKETENETEIRKPADDRHAALQPAGKSSRQ